MLAEARNGEDEKLAASISSVLKHVAPAAVRRQVTGSKRKATWLYCMWPTDVHAVTVHAGSARE